MIRNVTGKVNRKPPEFGRTPGLSPFLLSCFHNIGTLAL